MQEAWDGRLYPLSDFVLPPPTSIPSYLDLFWGMIFTKVLWKYNQAQGFPGQKV